MKGSIRLSPEHELDLDYEGVICFANGLIIGGALRKGDLTPGPDGVEFLHIINPWSVPGMTIPWPRIVESGEAEVVLIPTALVSAIQGSLDQYAAESRKAVEKEAQRRVGLQDAIRIMMEVQRGE